MFTVGGTLATVTSSLALVVLPSLPVVVTLTR